MEYNIDNLYKPMSLTEVEFSAILKLLLEHRDGKNKGENDISEADDIVQKRLFRLKQWQIEAKDKSINLWGGNEARTFDRFLHGHIFLKCLVSAYNESQSLKYLEAGMGLIREWIECTDKGHMAYHDDATAVRLEYYLLFFIWAKKLLPQSDMELLKNEMWKTAELLASEDFHGTGTNHGMYQDVALLLYTSYFINEQPCAKEYQKLAVKRLVDYFDFIFTKDGIHKEHSPSYHFWILDSMRKVLPWIKEADITSVNKLKNIQRLSEKYSTHIFFPNGMLPPLCDSVWRVLRQEYHDLYESESFLFARTGGEEGTPPCENDVVFLDSGYAIFRDDWAKKQDATYVLFTAAYHVNYHKHSDDLNLVIYRGGEIVTESGPNGYQKDPITNYGYSSFAHNTLIVDGNGLKRTDGQYDKVRMIGFEINDQYSSATGVNLRYAGVEHKRIVSYFKKEDYIKVIDEITSEEYHEYILLWNIAPGIHIQCNNNMFVLSRDDKKVMEIEFVDMNDAEFNVYGGQLVPRIQGWKFTYSESKIEEMGVIEMKFRGHIGLNRIKTIFRLSNFNKLEEKFDLFKRKTLTYNSHRSLRYHFQPANSQEQRMEGLIVVFSPLNEPNNFTYAHTGSLRNVQENVLYILDNFGEQGAYYLGNNRNLSIEASVASLIFYTMQKCNIEHKRVSTVGMVKGGWSALYFGIKYHFGNVIVGAPQSRIGHFLLKQANHKNIAKYIAGGVSEADRCYLDALLFDLFKQPKECAPNIFIHYGSDEPYYKSQIEPLLEQLEAGKYNVEVDIDEGGNRDTLKETYENYLLEVYKKISDAQFY